MTLRNKWIPIRIANDFIAEHHRHHKPVVGAIFCLGTYQGSELCGVTTVGRPSARKFNSQEITEVTRLGTFGTKNACSKLYSACARIAREMGFLKIITYTGIDEEGVSLIASGWVCVDDNCGGLNWNGRERVIQTLLGEEEKYPAIKKKRWEKVLVK